jgi:hypothetical protein
MVIFFVFIDLFSKCLKKNVELNIDSAASTGSHEKYMKYVSFSWPPVVAARALHSSGRYWPSENYPFTHNAVVTLRSYQTVQLTVSYQNHVCCGN